MRRIKIHPTTRKIYYGRNLLNQDEKGFFTVEKSSGFSKLRTAKYITDLNEVERIERHIGN